MKRKLLATVSISLCLLLSACSGGASESIQQEIELSMDNVNDYIDFVSISNDEWIVINKQYENDMVYIDDNFEIYYELTSYITVEDAKQEKRIGTSNICSFSTIIESIDKPVITDINGTITLYKGGKAYYDSDKKQRIVEYGSNKKESKNGRTEYFNEYPY